MAYDTTLNETVNDDGTSQEPVCLRRDNLTGDYVPQTSRTTMVQVVILSVAFLLLCFHRLPATGLWADLAAGRAFTTATTEPFAANATAQLKSESWLAQRTAFWISSQLGGDGMILWHSLLVTLTIAVVGYDLQQRGASRPWRIAGTLACLALLFPVVGVWRAELPALLAMSLLLLGTTQLKSSRAPLVWLPLVFLLWANSHATCLIGLGVLLAMAIGQRIELLRHSQQQDQQRRSSADTSSVAAAAFANRLAICLGICLAATFVNPAGFSLWTSGPSIWERLALLRPIVPLSYAGLTTILSLVVCLAVLVVAQRRPSWHAILPLGLTGVLAGVATDGLLWWAVALPCLLAPYVDEVILKYLPSLLADRDDTARDASMRTLITTSVVFAVLLIAPPTNAMLSGKTRGVANYMVAGTPYYVADSIQQRKLGGNAFVSLPWADYTIWASDGRIHPLVYSHLRNVDVAARRDYLQIASASENWLELVEKHQLRYLIVSRKHHPKLFGQVFVQRSQPSKRVRVIYQDQTACIAQVLSRKTNKSQPQSAAAAVESAADKGATSAASH